MTTKTISLISATAFLGAALIVLILVGAPRAPHPQAQAPHTGGPGVIRVSVAEGSVVVQRGGSHVQTNAVRNAPLLPGDYISTGTPARAELQFDGYTAVRLGAGVQARIPTDDPNNRKVQLASGTVEIGMVRDGEAMQVDTPTVSVRAHQAGDYRITIDPDGSSWVTARRGSVDVVRPQGTETFGPGKTLVARGSASNPEIAFNAEVALDGFDDFNVARDDTMVAALNASPNLSPALAGYENLDAYGQWQAVAGYGRSWVPNEPSGWAPYRNGSWVWEGGYGWTWVGAEPWGWTPYHYGNWFYCACGGSGWAWLPPSSATTPKWAPALVGFFGFDVAANTPNNCGNNYSPGGYSSGGYGPSNYNAPASYDNTAPEAPNSAGAPAPYGEGGPDQGSPEQQQQPYGEGSGGAPPPGYAYPNIGWVPIAPGEPYYPWYPGWAWFGIGWGVPFYGGYGYGGYATHITNITNIYSYRNFRHGGASATTTRNFRHGTIHGHTAPVTGRDIGRHSGTIHGTVPVTPTRANLAFSHGSIHGGANFSRISSSPRFASNRALEARNSFGQQQKSVAQAISGRVSGHASGQMAGHHANARVSHVAEMHGNAFQAHGNARGTYANAPRVHGNVGEMHGNARQAYANAPQAHGNMGDMHGNGFQAREGRPAMHENAAAPRQIQAPRGENAPQTRMNAPQTRMNAPQTRMNAPQTRMNAAPAMRANGASAPASSWDRFSQARGDSRSAQLSAGGERGNFAAGASGEGSAMRGAGQEGRAPGADPWGRFSDARGACERQRAQSVRDRSRNVWQHAQPV